MSTTVSFPTTWCGNVVEDKVASSKTELPIQKQFHRPWWTQDGILTQHIGNSYVAVRPPLLPVRNLKEENPCERVIVLQTCCSVTV
jgi:hypothetical protein